MKSWLGILTIIGVSSTCAWGSGIGGFGSYWDSKDADDTIGGGAVLRLDVDQNIQLDIRGSYYEFDENEAGIKGTLEIIPAELALTIKIPIDGQIVPYIGGGAGYYFADAEFKSGGEKLKVDIDDEVGFFAIAGVEVMLGDSLSLFAEAKYTWLEFDKAKIKDSGIPGVDDEEFDIELDMTGFGVNVGLLLKF